MFSFFSPLSVDRFLPSAWCSSGTPFCCQYESLISGLFSADTVIWEAKAASYTRKVLMWIICSVLADVHLAMRHRLKPPNVLGMGCSRGDPGWAPFAFRADTAAHGAAPWEAGNLYISPPKPCSGRLQLPFPPAFVPTAFPTTPSSAGTQKGLLTVAQGWGVGALLGELPSVISSVMSMRGRLKSGHHIFLSFCYISVNLKKFE